MPLLVGAAPVGVLFGSLSGVQGLSLGATLGLSACVFAGSSQLVALTLWASGASLGLIWMTTFIVNLRHLLYAVSLLPYIGALPQRWKIPLAFWLTDESFALSIVHYSNPDQHSFKPWFQLGTSLAMYINWQLWTVVGAWAGHLLEAERWGLELAMPLTFLGMGLPYLRQKATLAATVTAGVVALVGQEWPHQLGLVTALAVGVMAGYLVERVKLW